MHARPWRRWLGSRGEAVEAVEEVVDAGKERPWMRGTAVEEVAREARSWRGAALEEVAREARSSMRGTAGEEVAREARSPMRGAAVEELAMEAMRDRGCETRPWRRSLGKLNKIQSTRVMHELTLRQDSRSLTMYAGEMKKLYRDLHYYHPF